MPSATFDDVAPGLMLFAILALVGHTAASLAREWELRTLHRYRLAGTGAFGLVTGTALAQLILAAAAFAVMLVLARLFGFHNEGSLWVAYIVVLLAALSVTGIGMIVAAFARGRDEAANLALLLVLPMGFLSGAFFDVPNAPLWPGSSTDVYEVLPSTHAMHALRQVLSHGADAGAIQADLIWLGALGIAFLALGTLLFGQRRLAKAA